MQNGPRSNVLQRLLIPLLVVAIAGCYAGKSMHTWMPARPPDFLVDSAWLTPGDTIPELGAVGYVLLGARPDSIELDVYQGRANLFRRAINEAFHFSSNWTTQKYSQEYFVTFWLNTGRGDASFGRDWYRYYDYIAASRLLHALGRSQSRGPVLAAWHRDVRFGTIPQDSVLVLDLSNVADTDLDVAVRIWRRRITDRPAAWKKRFDLSIVTLEFAGFLNEYGQTVLSIVSPK